MAASDDIAEGYPDALFLQPLPHDFRCIICQSAMKDAVVLACQCSTSACNGCVENWFRVNKAKSCPQCRSEVALLVPNRPVRSQIRSLRVRCQNFAKGCMWEGLLEEMEARHIPRECGKELIPCPYNPTQCPSKGKLTRDELQAHRETCPFVQLPCQHCKTLVLRNLLETHLQDCPHRPVECPRGCGAKDLLRSTVAKHAEVCPRTPVVCPMPGCPVPGIIERRHLAEHMKKEAETHAHILLQRNTQLQKERTSLSAQLAEANTHLKAEMRRADTAVAAAEELKQRLSSALRSVRDAEEESARARAQLLEAQREIARLTAHPPPPPPPPPPSVPQPPPAPSPPTPVVDNWTWDPNDKDPEVELSNGNKTVSSSHCFEPQSVAGTQAWSRGVHNWSIRIDHNPNRVIVGVHPHPRAPGGLDDKAFGACHDGWKRTSPSEEWNDGSGAITFKKGDVLVCWLDCDAHTFAIATQKKKQTPSLCESSCCSSCSVD